MMTEKFPFFSLKGSPKQIGLQHGQNLMDLIHQNVALYKQLFPYTDIQIREKASRVLTKIEQIAPDLSEEIRGISEGAQVPLEWIVAINARSEFMSPQQTITECTTTCFPNDGILAQTWDWLEKSQNLTVLLQIEKESTGHKILTLTEAGIIGKIGINNSGLGVTLNFLSCGKLDDDDFVPIHVLLRLALECKNLDNFKKIVDSIKGNPGISGAVILCSGDGNFLHYEFQKRKTHELPEKSSTNSGSEVFFRTNHYLASSLQPLPPSLVPKFSSTLERWERVKKLCTELPEVSEKSVKSLLQDSVICRTWVPNPERHGLLVGTVAVVVMDLKNFVLHVTCEAVPSCSRFKKFNL